MSVRPEFQLTTPDSVACSKPNAKYWNKKVYVDPAEQAIVGDLHGAAFVNYRALRYADVVLIAGGISGAWVVIRRRQHKRP